MYIHVRYVNIVLLDYSFVVFRVVPSAIGEGVVSFTPVGMYDIAIHCG